MGLEADSGIAKRVKALIIEELNVAPELVTPDALLEGGHLWVSLDVVEAFMICEEEFGITIPDEEAENTHNTVAGLIALVERKMREKR